MVSNQKINFFSKRVEQIGKKRQDEIEHKYPEIRTDYVSLICAGEGKMKSEAEIRGIIGNSSRYSCPATVEVVRLFDFNGERQKAEKKEAARKAAMAEEKAALQKEIKAAMDLVYFGTDEQLRVALEQLEAGD